MSKIALVLAGGGAKGSFEAGVIKQLSSKYEIEAAYGSSVGALNAVGYSFLGADGLLDFWYSISSIKNIAKFNWMLPWANGVYSLSPLRNTVEKMVNPLGVQHCRSVIAALNTKTWEVEYMDSTCVEDWNKYKDAVVASAAIPGIFEPIGDLVDGATIETAPLGGPIEDGYSDIVMVLTKPVASLYDFTGFNIKWPKWLNNGVKAFERMRVEILANDIMHCLIKNSMTNFKQINLTVYAPKANTIGELEFDKRKIKESIEDGLTAKPIEPEVLKNLIKM